MKIPHDRSNINPAYLQIFSMIFLRKRIKAVRETYNFCAGPATMPLNVLKKAQDELLDWQKQGASVMEVSHRGKEFVALAKECEANLRELLDIPVNYKVLFLQGGGLSQFGLIPLNLLGNRVGDGKTTVDYLETGVWSKKAAKEGSRYAISNIIYSGKEDGYIDVPNKNYINVNPESAYLHLCSNETINGVEFFYDIKNCPIPVVADMSSNILSKRIDVSQYGLIYAGAQKNIGPAGLTLVIIREDLLGNASPFVPDALNYTLQAENDSMLNTPPTFAIYLMSLVLEELKKKGGLEEMEKLNHKKAFLLYSTIDNSRLYRNPIHVDARSNMTIPFTLADPTLDSLFLKEAEERKLINLKGHRSVGGMRASIYNAMPIEGVIALTNFMKDFEAKHYS